MRKHNYMNIGMISFIVVFIIISLVTFATLSFVTAKNNLDTATRYAEHETNYYALEKEAYKEIDEIDKKISSHSDLKKSYTIKDNKITFTKEKDNMKLTVVYDLTHKKIISMTSSPSKEWKGDESMEIL